MIITNRIAGGESLVNIYNEGIVSGGVGRKSLLCLLLRRRQEIPKTLISMSELDNSDYLLD